MENTYSPVPYVYRELIDEAIAAQTSGKIFYFTSANHVDSLEGKVVKMEDVPGKGLFIELVPQGKIRIDRIITLFGKPGAAYDVYDSYANACLDCKGGYDLDKLP